MRTPSTWAESPLGNQEWRDAEHNPKVAILIDDVLSNPRRARALEVRGRAELHETGGAAVNPRVDNLAPPVFPGRPSPVVGRGPGGGAPDQGHRGEAPARRELGPPEHTHAAPP